ncbi:hypothetical protein [Lachnoclostridium phytofermentans]|uniref:Uncharacterized protein n=1 Tax=Lachnoclostridium phytofermentans (strain ATCC 700394 / DSM 18823 / ISDg) TaxID=357809 RepID=A9KHE8_LACP7|nr:hypothetical protein [Lachnoclostridium phytofermentans]ABX40815.1 hypothetical protein Cphy_0428 [Lachnoclostridium phytofermentans ISDg]
MSDLDESKVTNETPGNSIERPEFETVNTEETNIVEEPTTNFLGGNTPNKPKKNNRTAGIIALVAGIAACIVIAIFAVPRIIEAVSRSSSSPKERFESAIENYLLDEAKSYEKTLSNKVSTDLKNSTISVDFNVTVNNMLTSMIKQTDPDLFADLKLDNIGGNFVIKNKEDKHNVDATLSANNTKLFNVESYFEKAADTLLFRIPELSSDYLSTPLNLSALESDTSLPQFNIESYKTPDAKEVTSLLTDSAKILTKDINDVSVVKDVKIVASDVSATYDKLTAKISEQDAKNILVKLMKRVYDVESYKNLLDSALLNSDSVNTFDEFISILETAEASNNTVAEFSIFVDKKNELHGCGISMSADGSNMVLSFLTAKGSKNGIELNVAVNDQNLMSLTSNYTKSSNGYQGFVKLFVNELDSTSSIANSDVSLTIDFENVKVVDEKNGHFTGSFYLTSPQLSGTSIELTFGVTGKKQDVTFNVSAASMSLFSLTASYQVTEGAEIVIPAAGANVYDTETEMNDYMSNAFMGLLELVGTVGDAIGVDLTSMMYGM